MRRGVVMEERHSYVTVLTPEGEFIRAHKPSGPYEIGSEILFVPFEQKSPANRLNWAKKGRIAVSFALFLLVFALIASPIGNQEVSAYVTIDINPSFEMGLDDKLNVIVLTGLNEEGKAVIREIDNWSHSSVHEVAGNIMETAKRMGFIPGADHIIVSSALKKHNGHLAEDLKDELERVSENSAYKAPVKLLEGTDAEREKAQKAGLSTGKYLEQKQKTGAGAGNDSGSRQNQKANHRQPKPSAEKQTGVNKPHKGTQKQAEKTAPGKQAKPAIHKGAAGTEKRSSGTNKSIREQPGKKTAAHKEEKPVKQIKKAKTVKKEKVAVRKEAVPVKPVKPGNPGKPEKKAKKVKTGKQIKQPNGIPQKKMPNENIIKRGKGNPPVFRGGRDGKGKPKEPHPGPRGKPGNQGAHKGNDHRGPKGPKHPQGR